MRIVGSLFSLIGNSSDVYDVRHVESADVGIPRCNIAAPGNSATRLSVATGLGGVDVELGTPDSVDSVQAPVEGAVNPDEATRHDRGGIVQIGCDSGMVMVMMFSR
jgi:hypothetical protein